MTQPTDVTKEQAREAMPELTGSEPFFMVMNTSSGHHNAHCEDITWSPLRLNQSAP